MLQPAQPDFRTPGEVNGNGGLAVQHTGQGGLNIVMTTA